MPQNRGNLEMFTVLLQLLQRQCRYIAVKTKRMNRKLLKNLQKTERRNQRGQQQKGRTTFGNMLIRDMTTISIALRVYESQRIEKQVPLVITLLTVIVI